MISTKFCGFWTLSLKCITYLSCEIAQYIQLRKTSSCQDLWPQKSDICNFHNCKPLSNVVCRSKGPWKVLQEILFCLFDILGPSLKDTLEDPISLFFVNDVRCASSVLGTRRSCQKYRSTHVNEIQILKISNCQKRFAGSWLCSSNAR